jgi:hypothetical protein
MRVVAIHDAAGNILTLIASAEDGPGGGIHLEPGHGAREIEVAELDETMDHPELKRRLDELIENYRVDVSGDAPKARLVSNDA